MIRIPVPVLKPRRVFLHAFIGVLALLVQPALHLRLGPDQAWAQAPYETDGAVAFEAKVLATARRYMISAANPHAVEAGLAVLAASGSAVDAAITAQMVLGLVEPQSSGIGGGAFLLHWDEKARRLASYDGRETAPAAIAPDVFMGSDGRTRGFWEAVTSGESVGVPGVVSMLAIAHLRHGKRPWHTLFEPAIRLAEQGFAVSRRLSGLLAARGPERFDPVARAYFFDASGKPRQVGDILVNKEYAAVLRAIADGGPEAFHKGRLAERIVAAVGRVRPRPGSLSAADMAGYLARERQPVCTIYRKHRICGMGPPSSGGLATAMTLKLLEPFDLGREPLNARALHLVVEAQKLAYADRDRWVADPDRVQVPPGLLDSTYLEARRRLINAGRVLPRVEAGSPPGAPAKRAGLDATDEVAGTTHLSVVDAAGNAVALTSSIEAGFGSGIMVDGFLLNNQLTDFSFRPSDAKGRPIANAVEPGKRPRSSMSPTIVIGPDGRLAAVLGSPGGARIPLYVIKTIVGLIDWRLDAQAAASLPNFGSRNGPAEVETEGGGMLVARHLRGLGHELRQGAMTSGLHVIVRRRDGGLEGGADPRREGVARGE